MPLITSRVVQDAVVVELSAGRILPGRRNRVYQEVKEFLLPRAKLVLDLGSLTAFDAVALGLLIRCIRQASKVDTMLCLCSLRDDALVFAEMVRLHQIVDIYNSSDEAVRALAAAGKREMAGQSFGQKMAFRATAAAAAS